MSSAFRILVIDDNPDIHLDFRKVLCGGSDSGRALDAAESLLFGSTASAPQRSPFEIDSANQGEAGLALVHRAIAEGRPYAVAFVDMRMPPGWDGLETITQMMPADPRLQLVICTAFSDYSWQQLTQRLGTSDRLLILKKPFDPIEILQLAHTLTMKWSMALHATGERHRLETAVTERTTELALANTVLNRSVLELRTTVAQLGRSEARFRAVVESAAAAFVIIDARGAIWLWNPGAERLFGWSAAETVGRMIGSLVDGITPLPRILADHPLELSGTARDGRRLELEISLSRWQTDDGEFACCIMQDIGPRKQAHQAIIVARDAAESAASARSDFLAVVSHELRTPMNGILGMTDLLLETALDGEQREFAGTVRSCASSLLGQINEILDFSRIEAGKMDVQSIEFDPRSAAEDVLELLAPMAQGKGLDLVLAVDASVPWLASGDPARFKQILTNLIGNALKFTASGSVEVELQPLEDVPEVLRLSVVDTGIGIAREDQPALFEPFVQVESPITRRYGGTGLGLAICRRLVTLMGGRMGLESTPGDGSRFWCELPLPARPDPVDAAARALDGLHLMHVDSSATGREALASLVVGSGITCVGVADPDTAMALIETENEPFSVVVAECRNGTSEGLVFAKRINDADGPPVLLLVRDAKPGLGAQARAAGAAGLLVHPVGRGQLHEALRVIRSGGHVDTGMITRHSLAERRRRCQPWILVAIGDLSERRWLLIRLQHLGCRVDVCTTLALAESCSRRAYNLIIADFSADGVSDPAILHARLPAGHETTLLAWVGSGGAMPAGCDGVLDSGLDPAAFEAELQRHLTAADRRTMVLQEIDADPVSAAIDVGRLGTDRMERLAELAGSLPAMVSAVMLAIARNDPEGVHSTATVLHRLCLGSGALPLAALAEQFEHLGAARDMSGCARAAGELHSALRHALASLKRMRIT